MNSPPSSWAFKDLCFWSVAIQNQIQKLRNILNIGRKTDEGPSRGLFVHMAIELQ
jgi:hypothetical protein